MASSVISQSILTRIELPSENWIPPKEFLLGLGQPWEPDPWEYVDEDDDNALLATSQGIDKLVNRTVEAKVLTEELDSKRQSSRWASPKCDKKLKKIRQDGIPKQTQKQTDWAVSVWV